MAPCLLIRLVFVIFFQHCVLYLSLELINSQMYSINFLLFLLFVLIPLNLTLSLSFYKLDYFPHPSNNSTYFFKFFWRFEHVDISGYQIADKLAAATSFFYSPSLKIPCSDILPHPHKSLMQA